ncbi:hypothetical protein ATO12_04470 [Aquimarina atlantica]|uniref:Uncharacterized protein n=1 Tax=Aquimarina atlantica TaxID=1317122 RepID=A0A023C1B3_9FLAO|nr:hypothetical protein [Aquimarina atlantica]EZH76050.1 hypothetical protein ATO12_04470 [Aquimarina atlantica]
MMILNLKKEEFIIKLFAIPIICITIITGAVLYALYHNDNSQITNSKNNQNLFYFHKSEALTASHAIINKRLRSSTIISFGESDKDVRVVNDSTFTVINYVDWINQEGENKRNYYCCTVIFNHNCKAKARNLVFMD